jgi:hypothetical protein
MPICRLPSLFCRSSSFADLKSVLSMALFWFQLPFEKGIANYTGDDCSGFQLSSEMNVRVDRKGAKGNLFARGVSVIGLKISKSSLRGTDLRFRSTCL